MAIGEGTNDILRTVIARRYIVRTTRDLGGYKMRLASRAERGESA